MSSESAGKARFERELRKLRREAEVELTRLDEERRRLRRLISFADDYTGGRGRKLGAGASQAPISLLRAVREHPGVRASMLARLVKRPFEQVEAELADLARRERVERTGLGWRRMEN